MRILQFAFDGNPKNTFLPANLETTNTVIYTGTHDNDTTVGWYFDNAISTEFKNQLKRHCNREPGDSHPVHHDLIYLAMSSVAATCIIPLQDILGFGNDCRMNTPGTSSGNWRWRCAEQFLTGNLADWLREKTALFNRLPESEKIEISDNEPMKTNS